MSKHKIELEIGPRLAKTIEFAQTEKAKIACAAIREYGKFIDLLGRAVSLAPAQESKAPGAAVAGCISERAWGRCGKPLAPGASHYCVDCLMSPTKTEIEMIEQKESEST